MTARLQAKVTENNNEKTSKDMPVTLIKVEKKIAVIGLGYFGNTARKSLRNSILRGFDINGPRVDELMNGHDRT